MPFAFHYDLQNMECVSAIIWEQVPLIALDFHYDLFENEKTITFNRFMYGFAEKGKPRQQYSRGK